MRPARSLLLLGFLTLVVVAILCVLGAWQVERLAWKEALIARVDAGLAAAPVPAPGPAEWPTLDLATREYQPVTVSGTFRNDQEIAVVYALTEPKGSASGIGFMIMTPLTTNDGWTVYVNRGFVPLAMKLPEKRAGSAIEGPTTVTGLLRQPADRNWFMPGDNAPGNEWFSRDPKFFATAEGLPASSVAPYIIDAKFDSALPGGLPQGGETIVAFPNNHLGYAITWFGLALASLGVFGAFAWKKLRQAP